MNKFFLSISAFLFIVFTNDTAVSLLQPHTRPVRDTHILCRPPSRITALDKANNIVVNPGTTDGMVWIKGGTFQMGSDEFADSKPAHTVAINGFWMDEHEVTNAQFAVFAKATGYITVAERALNPADFPGVPADKLVPGSAVFTPQLMLFL